MGEIEGARGMELGEAAFKTLVHFAPDGVIVVDEDAHIVFASVQVEHLFGYDRQDLVGQPLEILIPERLRGQHERQRGEYQRAPRARPMGSGLRLVGRRIDGSEIPVEISLSPLYTEQGRYFTAIVRDVSERRAMEEAVHQSEERYRLLAENAQDIIYRIAIDPQPARVEYISPSVGALTGYPPEEYYEQPNLLLSITHPADRDLMRAILQEPLRLNGPVSLRLTRRDGSVAWHEQRFTVITEEGRALAVEGISRDITERVHVEEEARLLLAETEMQRERERIAADLHDGVMQSIYAVGLGLRGLTRLHELPDTVEQHLEESVQELNGAIADIRRYVMDLRPARYSGDLAGSVADVARVLGTSSGIEVSLAIDDDLPELPVETELALFHVVQEALSNVRRHAAATAATVRLTHEGDVLRLEVSDNGRGFEPGPTAGDHMGLRNMEMRTRSVGGEWRLDSAPGRGTEIRAVVPVQAHAAIASGD